MCHVIPLKKKIMIPFNFVISLTSLSVMCNAIKICALLCPLFIYRKLQEAKHKLRQLQSLVAMVQQTPEVASALPDDLAELAAGLTAGLTADYSESNNEDDDEDEEDDEEEEEEDETEEGDETVEESGSELAMAGATGDHRMPSRDEQIPAEFVRETR